MAIMFVFCGTASYRLGKRSPLLCIGVLETLYKCSVTVICFVLSFGNQANDNPLHEVVEMSVLVNGKVVEMFVMVVGKW